MKRNRRVEVGGGVIVEGYGYDYHDKYEARMEEYGDGEGKGGKWEA